MWNKLPPALRKWSTTAAVVAGIVWLGFNPQYLWEDLEGGGPPRQAENRADNNAIQPSGVRSTKMPNAQNIDFEFYVLALSWSPSYCASSNRTTGLQCGGKRFFSFIVHGLWPQYEKGWPSFCNRSASKVGNTLVKQMLDIMPGYALIQNQWLKHGTCTGLRQQAYFTKLRKAYEKIRFPARYRLNDKYLMVSPQEMEQAFRTENPGLPANAIAVTCGKNRLREVRICLSKDLRFRSCQEVDRNSCRKNRIVMPPVRES